MLAFFSKKRWALAAAFFHLCVLSLGSFPSLPPASWKRALFARDIYQAITGAGGGFGFFSPGLGNQLLLRFETIPPTLRPIALEEFGNGELALRLGNMVRLFAFAYDREDWKRSVSASLATQVFRLHPEATEVTFIASTYELPSLLDWKNGKRPVTTEAYRATFRKKVHP